MPPVERNGDIETSSEERLRRLLDVGRALVSELDLEVVLRDVIEAVRDLTGARYVALGILDEGKRELERFLHLGVDDETRREIGSLPRGRGILGELIRHPQALRIADVREHARSYGFPPGHPPMKTFLGVPIVIRGEPYGNLYLTEKEGGREFDESDEELVILLAQWAAVAIDNARLYVRVEERGAELERAVRGLEANVAMARVVAGETDPERVLELIAKRGRALLDARTLAVLMPQRERIEVAAAAGEHAARLQGASIPLEDSIAGEVLRTQRPERIADVSSHLKYGRDWLGFEASAALLVPMAFRGQLRGVLLALDRIDAGPQFDADDELLATSFAAGAAAAIFTARAVEAEKLQRSIEAAEHEKRRWSRELHDETLQELGGLRMMLESAAQVASDEKLRPTLARALEHAKRGIESIYTLINELRPAALDELGLKAAIESLADRIASESDVDLELTLDLAYPEGRASTRLSSELETAAYRLVQEALNNALKHSGASRIEIRVVEDGDTLTASVLDNGSGFDPTQAYSGFGLIGMHERVALVGGSLEIDANEGDGTEVRAELPVTRARGTGQASSGEPRPEALAG